MQSVLARARESQIIDDPFPHLVLHEALEPGLYRRLAVEFPVADIILDGRTPVSNSNFRYTACAVLNDSRISALWREFMRYHVSQAFFQEVRELFEARIRWLNPRLESIAAKPLADWQASIRFAEPIRDIALECQFAYGAPVEARSRTIGPHVDREVALYAGLFYMRDEHDDSDGGDLELYRFTSVTPVFENESRRVPDEYVTTRKTIRYASNTLVFFLHSPYAVHGVSPRSPTPFPRRHINFVGEMATKVFDLSGMIGHATSR
jgi:hypothetical protein